MRPKSAWIIEVTTKLTYHKLL